MKSLAKLGRYWRLTRRRAREGHLPVFRQLLEMLLLFLLRRLGPGYYQGDVIWHNCRILSIYCFAILYILEKLKF